MPLMQACAAAHRVLSGIGLLLHAANGSVATQIALNRAQRPHCLSVQ